MTVVITVRSELEFWFDISFTLNYTELKSWIFCYQFHFYAWPQNHLRPFNLRCSIAQQTKVVVRALGATWGHSLQLETFLQWKSLFIIWTETSIHPSHPRAWGSSSGTQDDLVLFLIFLPAPVICEFCIWFCWCQMFTAERGKAN